MKLFIANLKNELRKLCAKKKFYVFLAIEIIICLLWSLISMALSKISGGMVGAEILLSGMSMTMLGFFIMVYIPLMIFMASTDLYSAEVYDGTVRAGFMRPISRAKQYFSKATAIMIVAVVYLAVLFFITTFMQAIGAGTLKGTGAAFASYMLDVIPMIALVLFAAMLNQFSKSTSLSMLLCIIMYIGLYAAGMLIPQLGSLLFTGYLQWHNVWVGNTIPFFPMLSKIGIILGYATVFGCVGYYLFERREV